MYKNLTQFNVALFYIYIIYMLIFYICIIYIVRNLYFSDLSIYYPILEEYIISLFKNVFQPLNIYFHPIVLLEVLFY